MERGKYMNRILFSIHIIMLLLLSGCANTLSYNVNVDSICTNGFSNEEYKKYFILPDDKNIKSDNLYFQEVVAEIGKAFAENKMILVDDIYKSDYVVFINYGIGDEKEHSVDYDIPQFGVTGYSSSNTYGTYNSMTGQFSGSTYHNPIYGVTGYSQRTEHWTTYNRWVILKAFSVDHKSKKLGKQVWETQITSRGTSSDFRNVLPILIEVLKKDIATNTKGKIQYSVEIKENEKNPQMKITIEK